MPNKGRRIKAERSIPSHLFHRCFPPTHPCATQPSFLLLSLRGFGHCHNEILYFYHHFCRTLCGRSICSVDHQHTVSSFPNFPNYMLFFNSFSRTNVISCAPLQITFTGGTRSFPLFVSKIDYSRFPSSSLHHCMYNSRYFVFVTQFKVNHLDIM
jgi:hypothetical protein